MMSPYLLECQQNEWVHHHDMMSFIWSVLVQFDISWQFTIHVLFRSIIHCDVLHFVISIYHPDMILSILRTLHCRVSVFGTSNVHLCKSKPKSLTSHGRQAAIQKAKTCEAYNQHWLCSCTCSQAPNICSATGWGICLAYILSPSKHTQHLRLGHWVSRIRVSQQSLRRSMERSGIRACTEWAYYYHHGRSDQSKTNKTGMYWYCFYLCKWRAHLVWIGWACFLAGRMGVIPWWTYSFGGQRWGKSVLVRCVIRTIQMWRLFLSRVGLPLLYCLVTPPCAST